ncbi:MAG TPA: PaaI family thioesterase [Candidatus Acidoferrales bacterium]|nr:PaaI family thioesterase [Candidatus Acidoferrales bacterium]
MPSHLENLERVVRGELPQPPAAQLIGFKLTSIRRGESTVEIDANSSHANPMGTLHGGILCDVADFAMGTAYISTLEEGETFTTLELKINFLRPVWTDHLIAAGRVIQRGKTIGLVESTVTNSNGARVAFLTSTCMTLRGQHARGR